MLTIFSKSQILKGNNVCFIAAILSFVCIALLPVYFVGLRLYTPLPTPVFWVLIISAIGLIVFQIVRIPWPGYEPILIVEIVILGIALHMAYIVPFYGLPTSDSLRLLALTREIAAPGIVVPDSPMSLLDTAAWPLLPIWGAELHYLTGITTRNIALWFPALVISGGFVLMLYTFIKRIFENIQVALMVMLLIVTVLYFTLSGISFRPELFALGLMMTGLYFLTRVQGGNRIKFAVLSTLCFVGVIFAHHQTTFVLMLFFIVYSITNRALSSLGGNRLPSSKKNIIVVSGGFTLLAAVATLSYWVYLNEAPLFTLIVIGKNLLYGAPGSTLAETAYVVSPQTLITFRGQITFWGYYIFHAVFAIILLRGFFARRRERRAEYYSFTIFLFVYGVWALVQLYALPATTPGVYSVARLVMLGWIWGFAPLAVCVLDSKRRWNKQLGIMILVSFMLFNVYMMPVMNWDFQVPGRAEGQIGTKEDHLLAETLTFTGKLATFKYTRNAIYSVHGLAGRDLRSVSPAELEEMDWVVIKKGELESYVGGYHRITVVGRPFDYTITQLSKLQELLDGSPSGGRGKIYDSNNLAVFK